MNKAARIMLSALAIASIFFAVVSCEKIKGGDKGKAEKTYAAEEFYDLVHEKTPAEVEAVLGKPFKIDKAKNNMEFYHYKAKVLDRRGRLYTPKLQFSDSDGRKTVVAVLWVPLNQGQGKNNPWQQNKPTENKAKR